MPEIKTIRSWIDKGHQFISLGNCEACGAPVEVWTKNNQLIPLEPQTLETHFSTCSRPKEYRAKLEKQDVRK